MSLSMGEKIILFSKFNRFIKSFTDSIKNLQDKSVKGVDINERKKLRAQKLEEFKDHTEKVLGASFDEDKWKFNNKDDEKKIEVKIYDRLLLKELNLTGHE